MISQYKLNNNT